MSFTIRIPLSTEIYDELDDTFISEQTTAKHFIWSELKKLCKDAKTGKLNKQFNYPFVVNGKLENKQCMFKDVTLKELKSNPNWVPLHLKKNEIKYFEYKITEKTLEYLKLFASFSHFRQIKYYESAKVQSEKDIDEFIKSKPSPSLLKQIKKEHLEKINDVKKATPTCLEHAILNSIGDALGKKVSSNIDAFFDSENLEANPDMIPPPEPQKPKLRPKR